MLGAAMVAASCARPATPLTSVAAPARVEFIAHRGESADAPENTMAAFQLAWQRGVPAIELDVHLTRDEKLIVSHDADTRRTTGVARAIKESTLDALRALDAGSWKGAQWAAERLPTLEEALATIPAGRRCLIEVKVGPEAIPALVAAVRASGKTPAQLAVISFNLAAVAEAKRQLPEIPAYLLSGFSRDSVTGVWSPSIDTLIAQARAAHLDALDLPVVPPLDADAVRRIRAAGLGLYVWTIDDPTVARRMVALGVDGITTNRAAWLRSALSAAPASEPLGTSSLGSPPVGASPLVIAHRGASGLRPEHTLAAYDLAITMGADYVEPDVVSTRDSVLVARHENEIGGTTDVARRFPERRTTRTVDGTPVTGWFVEDFTLAELRTLRAVERLPFRSHAHDGQLLVPTLDEVLALVVRRTRETGRPIGVYPETKHPSYFRSIGLPLEERLVAALRRHGLDRPNAPVFIQSFEVGNLQRLRNMTRVPLVQLVNLPANAVPGDGAAGVTYAAMTTPAGLTAIARYAAAIGVEKSLVQPLDSAGALRPPTALVREAHAAGLRVHVWTLRSDPGILPRAYAGDPKAEWRRFAALGVDGIFGDFPAVGVAARR